MREFYRKDTSSVNTEISGEKNVSAATSFNLAIVATSRGLVEGHMKEKKKLTLLNKKG